MFEALETLNHLKVGIIGGGHLGQAIAHALVGAGLEKGNLFISYGGSPSTYQKLQAAGLDSCLATNARAFEQAGIVLLTIKPKDIFALKGLALKGSGLVVSCMAGAPINLINGILETNVHRMMFSGPDTITAGVGVAAVYPEHADIEMLLHAMTVTMIKVMSEEALDILTAGVCMPAALLVAADPTAQQAAIERLAERYPMLLSLYTWALSVLPELNNDAEKSAYVQKMMTRGGVTEAIVGSLRQGDPLDDALIKGIARTKQIAAEIEQSIMH
jgi:pyrroline-5-carboxylate reductase